MVNIKVTSLQGEIMQLQGDEGTTLMELLRENDYDGIDGICGGSCSCATCHVHVAPDWQGKLTPRSEDESMLVECVDSYNEASSRLSCQIILATELDGMSVAIAEPE